MDRRWQCVSGEFCCARFAFLFLFCVFDYFINKQKTNLFSKHSAGFTPVRKVGKLPGPTLRAKYQKEYGFDEFELQVGAIKQGDRVVIVDDLLATGGSFAGAVSLVQQVPCSCSKQSKQPRKLNLRFLLVASF